MDDKYEIRMRGSRTGRYEFRQHEAGLGAVESLRAELAKAMEEASFALKTAPNMGEWRISMEIVYLYLTRVDTLLDAALERAGEETS